VAGPIGKRRSLAYPAVVSVQSQPTSARKRIRRKPQDAEREILDAAAAFLQTNDFRDLTVDEVMARTGMARSAFYNYFQDRNDLVMRLIRRIEGEMMEAATPWLQRAGDPLESLRTGLDQIVEIYARHGPVLRAVHEASYHDSEVERYYREGLIEDFIEVVADRLRAENRAGTISVPNPREVAHALLMMNANVLVERLGRSPADRPRAVAKTLRYMWVQAIYARSPDA
jgi:AcrR family transcriptional regulator